MVLTTCHASREPDSLACVADADAVARGVSGCLSIPLVKLKPSLLPSLPDISSKQISVLGPVRGLLVKIVFKPWFISGCFMLNALTPS